MSSELPEPQRVIGQSISHYQIVETLGGGGMGVVYKALDIRLNRFVALKFLSADLTRDREANVRFRQEAQAASSLDHPNICTIHEIDEATDGRLFLAMAFYSGETLKGRIERGQMPIDAALDVVTQIAQGLSRAHQSKIVHRDIKPANVMMTSEGLVKIVDFGLAKLTGDADVTRTGTTVGTIAYMSPEQARGELVGPQTDVWALGVVLYELLAGIRPFAGADQVALLAKVLAAAPAPLGEVARDVPVTVQRIVARALSPAPAQRYPSATEMLADLLECRRALSPEHAVPENLLPALRRRIVVIPVTAVILLGLAWAGVSWSRARRARWARETAIPEIRRLIASNASAPAFALALQVDAIIPNDPALAPLWPQMSSIGDFADTIAGAEVFAQPYDAADQTWQRLGTTPLKGIRLARGVYRFRVEKPGYEPRLLAARIPGNLVLSSTANRDLAMTVAMRSAGEGSSDQVPVSGGSFAIALNGFTDEDRIDLGPFLIDRHEVTNADFKRFVDAGGYVNRDRWRDLNFVEGTRALSAAEALATFVDTTGKPAPAGWELGRHPAGQEAYPVTGVSWYEAVAYCRAAGKTLPTLYHWGRAALSPIEQGSALAPAIVPLSNFSGKALAAVGTYHGLGPFGTEDMAGNAREWVWNDVPDGGRWTAGGSWSDPDYLFVIPYSLSSMDRAATNGFRCATYPAPPAARILAAVGRTARDFRTATPVSEEVFNVFTRQYAFLPTPPNARVEPRDEKPADWIKEVMTFDAGYEPGRVTMYVFLPKQASPPYQTLIQFTGASAFVKEAASVSLQPNLVNDFIPRSGRALVQIVFKGSYERWDPFLTLTGEKYLSTFRARMGEWRQDLGHAIDALATRPNHDIDLARLGYFGVSFGASTALPLLALEDRLKVAVLTDAGFTSRPVPAEADAVNYASHITLPVLMIGGQHDFLFPLETSQKPLFQALGTPVKDKKHKYFATGHAQEPRNLVIREVLEWLDRYLGPVQTTAASPR